MNWNDNVNKRDGTHETLEGYIESKVGDGNLVHKTGNETIDGVKTFTDEVRVYTKTGLSERLTKYESDAIETNAQNFIFTGQDKFTMGSDFEVTGDLILSNGIKPLFDKESDFGLYLNNSSVESDGTIKIPIDCVLGFSWWATFLLISYEGLYCFSLSTVDGSLTSDDLNGSYDPTNKILTISKIIGAFLTNQTVTIIGNGFKFTKTNI